MALKALDHLKSKTFLYGCVALAMGVSLVSVSGHWSAAKAEDVIVEEGVVAQEAVATEAFADVEGDSNDDASLLKSDKSPVDFEADVLIHDEETQIVTASGNVVLVQDGRTLKADKVAYNLKDDVAVADGNVVFVDEIGDTHYADHVTLTNEMTSGLISGLQSVLRDGASVWAEEAVKEGQTKYTLRGARYTACKPCLEDPEKQPPWQIKAGKVSLDQESHMVSYQNARLEVGGVPIFYTPYYAHPDGTVQQKSGLLTPSFGWSSQLGAVAEGRYYYAIAPDMDATFGLMMTGKEGPVLKTAMRKHFGPADLEMDSSITYSDRIDSVAGQSVRKDDEVRGHVFIDGRWDIDEKWRAGLDLNFTSDDQYLKQYDISSEDILENEIYAERFSGRDYAGIQLVSFQDLRVERSNVEQPELLPIGEASFIGEPNALLGGRWNWDTSILNLARDGNGQDVNRAVTELGWKRQDILPLLGVVIESDASLRGDVYHARDRDIASTNTSEDSSRTDSRFAPRASVNVKYPLKRDLDAAQIRIEPQIMFTAMPDMDNDSSIPNEDSQDSQIDISNLFSADRFSGLDRIEDRTHVSYGARTGVYGHDGSQVEVYVGQSYRFTNRDNPFNVGSGLDDQYSDYVGHINAEYEDDHRLDYRFQLDGSELSSERHELYGSTAFGPVELSTAYLYANGVPGTSYSESREEISGSTNIELNNQWALRSSVVYDLSDDVDGEGLTSFDIGVDYLHDCYNFSATVARDLTSESSGAEGTTIMFRFGFKNLGEYETDSFSLNSSSQ